MGQLTRAIGAVAVLAALAGCASEPTVEPGTAVANTPTNVGASKSIDTMPPQARAAMEAGGGRGATNGSAGAPR